MNPTLKQLKAFVVVAELGSFAEACERLFLSQPALTVTIQNLESAIGGRLLDRSTRRVDLTPEGKEFLPIARRLLTDWDNAFSDLERVFSMQRGKLTLAAMPSFASNALPVSLARFQAQYPDIDLYVHDIIMEDVIDFVRDGRVDLGISFEPRKDESLEFEPLFNDRSVAIVDPEHPLSTKQSVGWKTLSKYPFISLNKGSAYRTWIEELQAKAEARPKSTIEANQLTTVIRMVSLGMGVAVVPALCQRQISDYGAKTLRINGPELSRQVGIYLRKRHSTSVTAKAMINILKDEFAS